MSIEDPKKHPPQCDPLRLRREDLQRRLSDAAAGLSADLSGGEDCEELLVPTWIEPRDLIRIVAPLVCMN